MGNQMKNFLSDKDLAQMGITQGCIDALASVGALPDLIETTEGLAIPLAEFGALFEHIAMSFCMVRSTLLRNERAKLGTAGVDFGEELSSPNLDAEIDAIIAGQEVAK